MSTAAERRIGSVLMASRFGCRRLNRVTREKEQAMSHEVTMDVSTKFVLHKDVTVDIKKDGYKLGTLLISKGNIEWVPSGNYAHKKRLSWTKFAAMMAEHGADVPMS